MAEEKRESGNRFERANAMRKAMTMTDMMENTMARATLAFEDFLELPAGAGEASAVEPPPDPEVDVAAPVVPEEAVVEEDGAPDADVVVVVAVVVAAVVVPPPEVAEEDEEESSGMTLREKPLLTSL